MAIFYGIYDNTSVWSIDTVNKTTSEVVSSGVIGNTANALAIDPSRIQVFFIGVGGVEYWAYATNTVQSVGGASLGLINEPNNAAFYNNALWYFDHDTDVLCQATLSYTGSGGTAVPSIVGVTNYQILNMDHTNPVNTNSFGDIAIDRNNGILYAYTSRGRFYSVDLSDPSNTFSEIQQSFGDIRTVGLQLTFDDLSANLYGTNYTTGNWYKINAANGSLTEIYGLVTFSSETGTGFRDLGG